MLYVIFLLKIINGETNVPKILSNVNFNVPCFNLRNFKILQSANNRKKSNYLNYEPINNMINLFNSYYDKIDFNNSYSSIKKSVLNS